MFHLIALLFSIFSLVSCQTPANYHQASQGAAILSDARYLAGDGTFGAAYSQEDGVEFKEESDEYGNRKGSYSYIDPTGQRRSVSYTAGKDGFRPVGDHIPTAPPQVPPQPEYVPLAQYNPPDYQFPQQFIRPMRPFFNEFESVLKPDFYPAQGRFQPNIGPNFPIQPPIGRPIPNRPYQTILNPPYQPLSRPIYQSIDRSIPSQSLDKPIHQSINRPVPSSIYRPIPESTQRPVYQSVLRPTPQPVHRPIPQPIPQSTPQSAHFPSPLNRPIPQPPRAQSHYSPEYLARLYPEYQSSGIESIGKAGPQYNGITTPPPRRFYPPGKLEFNRTPDGFSYTFNKT